MKRNSKKQQEAIFKLVKAVVVKKYPVKDMKVLKKYGFTKLATRFKFVNLDTRKTFIINLHKDYDLITVGETYGTQYEASDELTKLYEKYELNKNEIEINKNKILQDYKNLVIGCNTTNQVIEAWPASVAVLDSFIDVASRSLPTTMSAEGIARINKTNLGAKRAG